MNNYRQIPTLDLRNFTTGSPEKKQAFIKEIGRAYEEIGFVALKGHFLTEDLVEDLYREVRAFFNLPAETKSKYEIRGIGGQRGFTSFGKEHAKGRSVGDLKEFWHTGQQLEEGSDYKGSYPENIEVRERPNFNSSCNKAYKLLEQTGQYVLRALALYIGLEENYFDPFVKEGNSILRPIYYPPIMKDPKDAVRAAAHTDINLITLLMGAQGKGLQVRNHAGEWIDAIAESDELIINVGDMLSRLTNNKLKSTVHRVVNPPSEEWGSARYSIPFFMHPLSEMPLNCLNNCVDETHPKKYTDITAGAFLEKRLREIGLLS